MVSITGETKVTGSHGIEIKCDTCIGQENFSETELLYCREVCQERRIWEHAKH